MRLLVLFALLVSTAAAHAATAVWPSQSALCRGAITAAERSGGIPDRLMQAIGAIESGRRDENGVVSAWPWTINAEGVGSYFNTKAEAIAAVLSLRARGVRSVDVGCMQVNLMYHGDAFASLDEAFDPPANARYAARFLTRLLAQTGSWPAATAGYHSLTPGIGTEYARKVLAVWARPPPPQPAMDPGQPSGLQPWAPPVVPAAGSTMSMGAGARIIPLSSPGGVSMASGTGRGLDAYRATPTRLAARVMPVRPNPSS